MQFLEANIQCRQDNYLRVEKLVLVNQDLVALDHSHILTLSSFAFPIVCKTSELREIYLAKFTGAGIETRPMIAGNMQNQPFYKKYVKNMYALPGTDFIEKNGFYCGNYPELSEADLETISECLYC